MGKLESYIPGGDDCVGVNALNGLSMFYSRFVPMFFVLVFFDFLFYFVSSGTTPPPTPPPIPAPHPLQVVDKVAETCIINLCPSGRTSRSSSPFLLQQLIEEKDSPEVTLAHPKAKEWIVSMAKANYQELAKMASEYPELVKLQVSLTDSAFLSHF